MVENSQKNNFPVIGSCITKLSTFWKSSLVGGHRRCEKFSKVRSTTTTSRSLRDLILFAGFFRPKNQYTDANYHNLLTRWFQFGAFTPIFRIHGQQNTEIWNFGDDVQKWFMTTDNLRYRLLPYVYSLAWKVQRFDFWIYFSIHELRILFVVFLRRTVLVTHFKED